MTTGTRAGRVPKSLGDRREGDDTCLGRVTGLRLLGRRRSVRDIREETHDVRLAQVGTQRLGADFVPQSV
jgi:hypothetical protein